MRTPINVPVLLASTSPRRIDLMSQVRIPVRIVSPSCEELRKKGEKPQAMVERLAREKAESVMTQAMWEHGAALIISADTTVVAPDGKTVLGKPVDAEDAVRMLRKLAGRTHTVYTGYCLLSVAREMKPERLCRVVATKVTMRKMGLEAIRAYVATGEPMDKAGSYAAQGAGMAMIESIRGSYTNVVGLPMSQLLSDLERKFGITPFADIPSTK